MVAGKKKIQFTREDFLKLYERNRGRLYYAALRVIGNAEEAEECVHDAMLRLLDFEGSLNAAQQDAWLYRTNLRLAVDRVRQRLRRERWEQAVAEETDDGEESLVFPLDPDTSAGRNGVDADRRVERIRACLMQLPDGFRTVVSLILFEGLDYAEVAASLGIQEASVRSQYRRGRIRLAELYRSISDG